MDSVLFGKAVLAFACLLCALVLLRGGFLSNCSERSFDRLALAAVLLTRLSVFALLYLILGYEVPSDVASAYLPEARAALQGKLVYRDFFTAYSPLFPYVAAIPVFLWNSGKSIALFAILVETVGLHYWSQVYRDILDRESFRAAVILYVFNPLYIVSVAMDGKNDVWVATALGVTFLLLKKDKAVAAGIAMAGAFSAAKFSALLPLPAVFAYAGRTRNAILSFAAASGAVYGLFVLNDANVLLPFALHNAPGQESSGCLPFLLSAFGISKSAPVYIVCIVAIGCWLCFLLWRRWIAGIGRQELVLMGNWAIVVLFVALLFGKKSFVYYLVWLNFPLCVFLGLLIRRNRVWAYVATLFFAVASIEPSLWYRWINVNELNVIPGLLANGQLQLAQLGVFVACEVVLVGGYAIMGLIIVGELLKRPGPT